MRFLVSIFILLLEITAANLSAQSKIKGVNWFPIGPADISGGQTYGGPRVNVSGRATVIAVNNMNPNDVWLGTANGGVWHSSNGGSNWAPMSDDQHSLAVGALALDDCNATSCATIYAGTGENALRRDTYYGAGLLIGGVTGGEFSRFVWTPVGESLFSGASINNIVLDPTTSGGTKVIYVALSSGVTASATESTVTAPAPSMGYGIYKSTNRGGTWSKLTVPGATGAKPTDLRMSPSSNQVLYAGFLGTGIFKSVDGGNTWCPLNPGIALPAGCVAASGLPNPTVTTFDYVGIAIYPGDASIVYATLGSCSNPIEDSCGPAIYKSTDGGSTWTLQLAADTSPGFAFSCPRAYSRYTHLLITHPTDSHTLFLGGTELCQSSNDGHTFTDLGTDSVHPDHHALVFPDPGSINRMYDASDGGFAISNDGGAHWNSGNADLQITGFQSLTTSPLTARLIGGTQDNGTNMWMGTRVWRHIGDGDAGFTIMDLNNMNLMYSTDTRDLTGLDGTPARSNNGGMDFFPTTIESGIDRTDPASFYPVFIQDPSPPRPLYFGTNRLYKSTNQGDSWTVVSPVLGGTAFFPDINRKNAITAVAVAPNNPNRIYVGYYDGQIWVTNGACASSGCWSGPAAGLPHTPVTWIAVDPGNADVAYASFSGFNIGPHVFKTFNGSASWSSSSGGLPDIPANVISIEPSTHANLWLGTDQGVYKSTSSGDSWGRFSTGLPNVAVYAISIDENRGRVFAGTHGRGAFVLTQPFLTNFEGWVNSQIWDIPVYGNGFLSNQSCTMQIIQQNGNVCASSSSDARGGTIMTDSNGALTTSNDGLYMGQPVAFACFNGNCLGGTPIGACNVPGNAISNVTATCGGLTGIDLVLGCPQQSNPPSSILGLGASPGAGGPRAADARASAFASGGSLDFIPTVQAGDGSTRALCVVQVPFQASDTPEQVLKNVQNAVNSSTACTNNTVSATVSGLVPPGQSQGEDAPVSNPRLSIAAPGINGGQLLTSLHAAPGQTGDSCFNLSNIGIPVLDSITIMRVSLQTLATGAAGGQISMTEFTDLGTCSISLATNPGQTAAQIAAGLAKALQTPGIPGPNPDCPAARNPRDVVADGSSVLTVMAHSIQICVKDQGVGFALLPDELPLSAINLVQPVRILSFVANPLTILEGNSATLTWKTENAIDVTITNVGPVPANGSATVKPVVDTIYSINATGEQSHANAFVLVKVIPNNPTRPPVADAGPNQWTYANTATLSGIKSYDPQGSPITYAWRFVAYQPNASNPNGTPSVPVISAANTVTPTVKMFELGDYIFELTVTNALGLSSKAITRLSWVTTSSDPNFKDP